MSATYKIAGDVTDWFARLFDNPWYFWGGMVVLGLILALVAKIIGLGNMEPPKKEDDPR